MYDNTGAKKRVKKEGNVYMTQKTKKKNERKNKRTNEQELENKRTNE